MKGGGGVRQAYLLCCIGHQVVDVINEQDDLAGAVSHLVTHSLQTFLRDQDRSREDQTAAAEEERVTRCASSCAATDPQMEGYGPNSSRGG